jgi:hypothetical protein
LQQWFGKVGSVEVVHVAGIAHGWYPLAMLALSRECICGDRVAEVKVACSMISFVFGYFTHCLSHITEAVAFLA